MLKATSATLDGDSPDVVSCHRHPGLASGVADGKTGLTAAGLPPRFREARQAGGMVRLGRRRGVRRLDERWRLLRRVPD